MANSDRPRGAEPVGKVRRSAPYVAGADVYPGDILVRSADGKVDPCATGGSAHQTAVLGVCLSKGSDGDTVMVSDHPDQEYRIQADGADIAAQTDIGLNYDVLGTDPSTTYELSRMELDSSSGATTATKPLKLLRIEERTDNAFGAQVDCIVRINANQDASSYDSNATAQSGSLGV